MPAASIAWRPRPACVLRGCPSPRCRRAGVSVRGLAHVSVERQTIHGTVEDHRRSYAVARAHRRRWWSSNGHAGALRPALAVRRTAIKPCHLGRGARLVDEHQPMDVDLRLRRLPRRASAATSGRSCSLACAVFFERDVAAIEEPPKHARHETLAVGFKRWSAISASVMSGVASTSERISAACPWIRAERRFPPCAPASQPPVLCQTLTSSIAVDAPRRTGRRRLEAHALIFHGPNNAKAKVR